MDGDASGAQPGAQPAVSTNGSHGVIPRGPFVTRYRWATRILTWTILDPSSTTEDERSAAAAWLLWAAHGGEHEQSPFKFDWELTQRGITHKDLSRASGIPVRTIRAWADGTVRPTIATAHKIARLLGLNPDSVAARWCNRRR